MDTTITARGGTGRCRHCSTADRYSVTSKGHPAVRSQSVQTVWSDRSTVTATETRRVESVMELVEWNCESVFSSNDVEGYQSQ
mmetsp:Transcript_26511/g.41275  ORF Transcript_26511/g.41275 Transcript_26511/m.41275 type:complete len:83 (-) Transcript_26511:184-432(-)